MQDTQFIENLRTRFNSGEKLKGCSMDALAKLQQWYLSQCNDDWEHSYGVTIGTLDNPGWLLEIDLTGTNLEGRAFEVIQYGTSANAETSDNEWIHCKVEGSKFIAAGGPLKLEEIINMFLKWAMG